MKKVIWIGPVVNDKDEEKFAAISPAANKWQKSFIHALISQGLEVITLSYLPEPFFPKGMLFPRVIENKIENGIIQNGFLNVPLFRDLSLGFSLKNSAKRFRDFDYIITYNNSKPHIETARFLQFKYKMKWINIVADDLCCDGPDATVFLSYGYYKSSNQKNKFHFDGGIDPKIQVKPHYERGKQKRNLLFAGALNKWTGIEEFAYDFSRLSKTVTQDFELHIYGKGSSERITMLAKNDSRIKLIGYVSQNQLEMAMSDSFGFINPRPLNLSENELNFPSKLLTYLSFGKPVISTLTAGVAPYYKDVVYFYDGSLQQLSDQFIRFNQLDTADLQKIQVEIEDFIQKNSWQKKVTSFLEFIKDV